jgi:drug/metabolite transporter (DMT)-like permease
MSGATTGILCALLAAVSWGSSGFLVGRLCLASPEDERRSPRTSNGPLRAAFLVNAYGALAYALVFAIALRGHGHVTLAGAAYAVGGGALFGLAQAGFFSAMEHGPVSLVSPIANAFPLITLIASVVAFAAHVGGAQVAGILLIVAGVAAASSAPRGEERDSRGPLLALVPMIAWGLGWALISQATARMGWRDTFLIEAILSPLALAACSPLLSRGGGSGQQMPSALWRAPIVLVVAAIQTAGILSLNIGLSAAPGDAAAITAIASCAPLLTVTLALAILKERVAPLRVAGGLLSVAGVLVLALT